jgi:rubrerythrin
MSINFKEDLKHGLDFETRAPDIYKELRETVGKNPLFIKVLTYLEGLEFYHVKMLRTAMAQESADMELEGDLSWGVNRFFDKTVGELKDLPKLSDEERKGIQKGIEMEIYASTYYEKLLPKAEDEKTRNFLQFIKDQEDAHVGILQKTLDYLT